MKRSTMFAVAAIASLGLGAAIAVAFAHPGGMGPESMHGVVPGGMGPGMMRGMGPGGMGPAMMRGPMGAGMQHDEAFAGDMQLVHGMLNSHESIKRTVNNLPDGIRTITESDDPQVALTIKAHVASMAKRLDEGRIFNLFSPTLPVLFDSKDKIKTIVAMTDKGAIVTQTSTDAKVVSALQAHAVEVSELAHDGMAAMMRAARTNMGH